MKTNIEIVVPTYQRPHLIKQNLHHFAYCGCKHPIKVVDTSDKDTAPANQVTCLEYQARLNLDYVLLPLHFSYIEKIYWSVKSGQSTYFVLHSDDDFLNVDLLPKATAFLDDNPDYVDATGTTLSLRDMDNDKGPVLLVCKRITEGRLTTIKSQMKHASLFVWHPLGHGY